MHLPVYFDGQLLRCLVIGGGPSVLRKIDLFLEAGASVKIIAPQADFKIVVLASTSRVKWEQRLFEPADAEDFDLIVIGSEDVPNKVEIVEEVRQLGIPVNVCGDHSMSTFYMPAILREGELTVAVSSGGQAPFLAVEFIRRLHSALKGWGMWLGLASKFRGTVVKNTKDPDRRREYYEKFVQAGPMQLDPIPDEKTSIAEWLQILRHAKFGSARPPARSTGFVPRSDYATGYAAASMDEPPPPENVISDSTDIPTIPTGEEPLPPAAAK